MPDVLAEELRAYEAHRDELLGAAKGKFVLIKSTQVVDTFDSEADAIRTGYDRFGNVPFLVKQVVEIETPQEFTSNLLGI